MAAKPVRRRTQQPAAGQRWWRFAVLGLGVLLMAGSVGTWVAAWVTDPTRLPLKTIRITGELAHLDRSRLQRLVAEAIDGGFFSVDMRKLRDAAEQLAWVDEVSVRRVWPQTLVMDVTEQVPVARWGKDALVNGRGEIFHPENGDLPADLPRFEGDDAHAPLVVDFHRRASERFVRAGLAIQALVLRGQQDWQLQLDNGMTLLIGQAGAETMLEQFLAALPAIKDPQGRKPVRVDLRYENGFAVRWAPAVGDDQKAEERGDA